MSDEPVPASAATPDLLVPITLVPVEVFGGDCDCHERQQGDLEEADGCEGWSYGLSDAVQAWSDCNRAIGRIYRLDDAGMHRRPGETITVHVRADQVDWFKRTWGQPD